MIIKTFDFFIQMYLLFLTVVKVIRAAYDIYIKWYKIYFFIMISLYQSPNFILSLSILSNIFNFDGNNR